MIDEEFEVMPAADRFLRDLRFGRDRAESTTKAYAEAVSLYMRWCLGAGREWHSAAGDLGLFVVWLRYTPTQGCAVVAGPGRSPVRSDSRINKVLTAVRGFLSFAVASGEAPKWVMDQLYELGDSRDLPVPAQGEGSSLRHRLRARHRLRQPEPTVDRASSDEVVALFGSCRSARDRLIVLLMACAGLRRGEVAGLRRSDLHLLPDNATLGCAIAGAHLHVVRRANPNGAWAKSRRTRAVPLDFLVVRAIDLYLLDRDRCRPAAGCDFLLVNLFREPLGAPMSPDALNELLEVLSRRAGLARGVTPHQCRHGFASDLADSGASLDEIQTLLGHASPASSQPYLHPSADRMRAAIERVRSPRELGGPLQ
ncbi:tyrosine-type recombinase/integrase [Nocardia cyriacigeorgica]|uniref:tyrosine-type recombinase/integrase n=1 Tax=Nocardia cyriacigeorgica TaxID=135487 RepID=UPI002B4B68FC|nr:tyrosine-type recombinase/integrase [Nocardia cyriacigeorgica]